MSCRTASFRRTLAHLLALLFTPSPPLADEAAPRPNILLIVLDDLGYGSLGAYGSERIATPRIDRLAAEGIRFTRFYANSPNCSPTRAALLSGRYQHRENLSEVVPAGSFRGLSADVPTLPAILARAGYETMHLGKWHLGLRREEYRPRAHGYHGSLTFRRDLGKDHIGPFLEDGDGNVESVPGHLTDILTDRALDFLDRMKGGASPFFLSLWHYAPHVPFQPPKRFAVRAPDSPTGRYGAMIEHLDEQVGRLLDRLDANGQAANTAVLLLSDNGALSTLKGANGGLSGGKGGLREGGIRTPFVLRWPAAVAPGSVSGDPVVGFDLLPTLAEWAGADVSDLALDGRSHARAWTTGGAPPDRGTVFFNRKADPRKDGETWAVLEGRFKLLAVRDRRWLFDLAASDDERGRSDRSDLRPDLVTELERKYDAWRIATTEIPIDAATRRFDFHDGDFTITGRFASGALTEETTLALRPGSFRLGVTSDGRLVGKRRRSGFAVASGDSPVTIKRLEAARFFVAPLSPSQLELLD
jgi:arylsulfatase A-like enzyme